MELILVSGLRKTDVSAGRYAGVVGEVRYDNYTAAV